MEAVLASPADYNLGKEYQIQDTKGNNVNWESLSPHVKRILSVMAWLGNQYIWHQVYSSRLDAIYLPHPLRDFFAYDFLERLGFGSKSQEDFAKSFKVGIRNVKSNIEETWSSIGLNKRDGNILLPTFLPFLVKESRNGKELLDNLINLREQKDLVELRKTLNQIEIRVASGYYVEYNNLIKEIEEICVAILRERGLEQKYIKISPPLKMFGISISGEDIGKQIQIPNRLYKQYFFKKRYRVFIKKVIEELSILPQLGDMKDKLNSYANIRKQGFPPFYLNEGKVPSFYYREFSSSIPPIIDK